MAQQAQGQIQQPNNLGPDFTPARAHPYARTDLVAQYAANPQAGRPPLLPPAHFTTPKELYRVRRTVAAQPPQLMVHDIEMLLARDDNRRFTHQVLVDLGALCNQEPLCPDHGVEMYKYLPNVDNQPPKYEANESCTRHRGHRIVYR